MFRFRLATILTLLLGMNAVAQESESLQAVANQKAADQLVEVLVNDMNELIPTDYVDGSDAAKRVVSIAQAYVGRKQNEVASLLEELATADPTAPPKELILASLAYATNNPNNGRILLERGAVVHKKHPGFALAFARLALLQSRFFDSVALTEKARQTNRSSDQSEEVKKFYETSSVALLTIVEMRRNELTAAANYARQWSELAPKDDKMFLAAAEVKYKQGKLESATEFLNQRSRAKQDAYPTEVVLAKWYQADGQHDKHAKWIDVAIEKYPGNKLAQIEFAVVLLRAENFERALEVLDQYESAHGVTADSELIRGRIAFSNEDYAAARSLFAKLFQLQPNSFERAYLYVLTLLENSDPEVRKQAQPLAQRVYQLNPNNQLATALLGWTLLKTGNAEPGSELIKRAQRIGAILPDTAYFLAKVMEAEGRDFQAQRILEPIIGTSEVFLFRSRAQDLFESLNSNNALPDPADK